MRHGRRRPPGAGDEFVDEHELVRDAEESLVAALQESDTAVEAIADAGVDGPPRSRVWTITATGLLLGLLGLLVARRRR